jgi:chitin disaccharide deacetylase
MIRGMRQTTKMQTLVLGVLVGGGLAARAGGLEANEMEAIRLIVRGDDMGSSESSNRAHIDCYRDGVMRTVEVMAVGPWFPEAARLLRKNPGLDVGLHLTLTSEWDTVKWRPLTHAPSLVEEGGWFFPMVWPNENYGKDRALKEQPWKLDEIERELRAQIELTRREVPHLSHLSGHMGFAMIGEEVGALMKRLATEYGLDVDPGEHGARSLRWEEPKETPEQKVETFARMLETLAPGTWVFVDHPAYDAPEMRAVHHVGYDDVAVDRQGVVEAWTSPRAKEIVARRGIELIGYRDLVEK